MPLESEIRLRFIKGDLKGKVYKVEGETIVLGRGDECDIRLNDPNVSRKHAVILCKDGDIFVKDNASKNGVSVNGQKTTFHKLGLSDHVEIGGSEFELMGSMDGAPESPTTEHRGSDLAGGLEGGISKFNLPKLNIVKNPATRKRIILYGSLAIVVGIVAYQKFMKTGDEQTSAPAPSIPTEPSDRPVMGLDSESSTPSFDEGFNAPLSPSDLEKRVNRLYANAILFHDIGKFNEGIQLLDQILDLTSQHEGARLKKSEWLRERNGLAQELLARALRNFENRYYQEAKDYFNQVLHLIPEPSHPLHKQAQEGLNAAERFLVKP